ncbi:MAG TPA: carbohydrate kinase family protein [Acidimicrobiales bacterium]|nr:carbohydrate kinase family protein [Acidimicrobiales bacterium]
MGAQEKPFDIAIIGDSNPDIVLRGADLVPEFSQHEKLVPDASLAIGGSACITACACARLGLRTRFVGAIGEDLFGRFMLASLGEWRVDTALCQVLAGAKTGFSVILSAGDDRAILTFTGTIDSLVTREVPFEELVKARHVHIGSYFLQPRLGAQLPELVTRLRAAGTTVSVDPNWDPSGQWDGGLKSLIRKVDLFLPNAAEAKALTGAASTTEAAWQLAKDGTLVAVKDGARGAVAAQGGGTVSFPGFPVAAIDATGAGDAFDAGFLRAWLEGRSLEQCLALGCAVGALSTRTVGATDGLPSLGAAQALVDKE